MTCDRRGLARIIVASVMFIAAFSAEHAAGSSLLFWGWLLVFLPAYLVVGYDVLLRAAKNILRGKVFDENFLMMIATAGAFALGEYSEGVAVMLFYQVGEYFQSYAVGRSRRSIAALFDICPRVARVATPDGEVMLPPEEVEVGAELVVLAGERVPIDGVVTEGEGYLDLSALTGESTPVAVSAGDSVLSGAIDLTGVMRIKTQKRYEDSAVARILELVENASAKKARTENFITRFAAIYTPAVVAAALLLALLPPLCLGGAWTVWITRALTFLVVSCPCALVISVPMSFFGGIGAASRRGILVKGGSYLELLHKADIFVFDKTGTVTKGVFEVSDVLCVPGVDRAMVLGLAAAVERMSNHPVAQSVYSAAVAEGADIPAARCASELSGRGIVAELDGRQIACGNAKLMAERGIAVPEEFAVSAGTVVYVADERLLGAIVVSDVIKPDSAAAIAELRTGGAKTVILTGDNAAAANAIAREAGADEVYSQLLPADKVEMLEKQMAGGGKHVAAFVGDGINDAPVLSRADVGLAMGALGSDAAIEAADIVLMNDSLFQIVTARRIAGRTVRIVFENIIFALGVKALVLALAAFGLAGMWLAVFADVGVAVLAILNALRTLSPVKMRDISATTADKGDKIEQST